MTGGTFQSGLGSEPTWSIHDCASTRIRPSPAMRLTYTRYSAFLSLAAALASALTKACRGGLMVHRPTEFSAFEFVVLSGLRAAQLMRGCTHRESRAATSGLSRRRSRWRPARLSRPNAR